MKPTLNVLDHTSSLNEIQPFNSILKGEITCDGPKLDSVTPEVEPTDRSRNTEMSSVPPISQEQLNSTGGDALWIP